MSNWQEKYQAFTEQKASKLDFLKRGNLRFSFDGKKSIILWIKVISFY